MANAPLFDWELVTRTKAGSRRETKTVTATSDLALLSTDGGTGMVVLYDVDGAPVHAEAMLNEQGVGLLSAHRTASPATATSAPSAPTRK